MASFILIISSFCLCRVVFSDLCVYDSDLDKFWTDFKRIFGKKYTMLEEPVKKYIWKRHLSEIVRHNIEHSLGYHSYTRGLNHYADLSEYEYKNYLTGYKKLNPTRKNKAFIKNARKKYYFETPEQSAMRHMTGNVMASNPMSANLPFHNPMSANLPFGNPMSSNLPFGNPIVSNLMTGNLMADKPITDDDEMDYDPDKIFQPDFSNVTIIPYRMDWRNHGAVTPVKDQGECGSCWSFSSTGALEAQIKKKTGTLVSLSEQNLVDCVYDNGGCYGGWMDAAFEYISNHGLATEASYPYKGRQGDKCYHVDGFDTITCKGFANIDFADEVELLIAVATVGPVCSAIDASLRTFHTYKSGIYDDPHCAKDDSNHAILIVGYGSEDGVDYWIIKNSWGPSWGESGYMRLLRNRDNFCGIATVASYPVV